MALINKDIIEKITKAFLRTLPFIPAPELYDLFQEVAKSKNTINQKINRAYESLRETSKLIEDLQNELTDRTQKVKNLKEKYENYARLSEIEEEKVKPLIQELEKTLGKGKSKERILSFIISIVTGLIIFIIGVWLGPKITPYFQKNIQNKEGLELLQKVQSDTIVTNKIDSDSSSEFRKKELSIDNE